MRADDEEEPHGQQRDQRDQHGGVERARAARRGLMGFLPHIDDEEGEQPDGEGQDEIHPAATQPAQERIPEEPEGDRDDADVETDQGEAEETLRLARGLDGHRDGGLEEDAGRADQADGCASPSTQG